MIADIANLIERQGEFAADAAARNGQIWAQTLSNLGQLAGNYPAEQLARTEAQQRQQIVQMQLDAAKRQQAANAQIANLPRLQDGTFDTGAIAQTLQRNGVDPENSARTLKSLDDLNGVITKANQTHTDHLADLANVVLTNAGNQPITPDDVHRAFAAVKPIKGFGVTDDDERQIVGLLAQGADARQLLTTMRDQGSAYKAARAKMAEPQKLGPGESIVIPGTGQTLASAPSRPVTVTAGGTLVNQDTGQPLYEAPARTTYESKSVLLNGKPAEVRFSPQSGKYLDAEGNDVTAQVRPMPPASVVYPKPDAGTQPVVIKPGTAEFRIAQDLASGRMTFSQFRTLAAYNRNAGLKFGIYDMARQLNPEFDPAQYELGFKMASNPQIRQRVVAINSLQPVINQISTLIDQAGNTDVPGFNKVLQAAKFQMGNRPVTNLRQLQVLLGDEVGNALGLGSGSDLKTRLGLDLVNPTLGPTQFKSSMQQLQTVVDARKQQLLKQMGIYAGAADNGAPPAGAAAPPATSPPPAAAPTQTFSVTAPNGKTYTFKTRADLEAFKARARLQ